MTKKLSIRKINPIVVIIGFSFSASYAQGLPLKPPVQVSNDPTPFVITESGAYETTSGYQNLFYASGSNTSILSTEPDVALHLNLNNERSNAYVAEDYALIKVSNS